jgi:hypothetical protein
LRKQVVGVLKALAQKSAFATMCHALVKFSAKERKKKTKTME